MCPFYSRHCTTTTFRGTNLFSSGSHCFPVNLSKAVTLPCEPPAYDSFSVEVVISTERSHVYAMNTFSVMPVNLIGGMNEFIASMGLNKEMEACPQHSWACVQSAIYHHTKTLPRLVTAFQRDPEV